MTSLSKAFAVGVTALVVFANPAHSQGAVSRSSFTNEQMNRIGPEKLRQGMQHRPGTPANLSKLGTSNLLGAVSQGRQGSYDANNLNADRMMNEIRLAKLEMQTRPGAPGYEGSSNTAHGPLPKGNIGMVAKEPETKVEGVPKYADTIRCLGCKDEPKQTPREQKECKASCDRAGLD